MRWPETSPLRQSKSVSCSQNHLPRERRGKSQVGGQKADVQVANPGDGVLRKESVRDLREIPGFCGFGRLRQHQLFVSRQFLPIE